MKSAMEEDVFDLQIGLGESETSGEDKHFFDTAGYLVLEDLLTPDQVSQAQDTLARAKTATPKNITLLPQGPTAANWSTSLKAEASLRTLWHCLVSSIMYRNSSGTPVPSRRFSGNTQSIGKYQPTHPRRRCRFETLCPVSLLWRWSIPLSDDYLPDCVG